MTKPDNHTFPFVAVPDATHECVVGWDEIAVRFQRAIAKNRSEKPILVVDCYPGVYEHAVLNELRTRLTPQLIIHAADAYHPPEKIDDLVTPFLDRKGPTSSNPPGLSLVNFFDAEPLWRFRRTIDELKGGLVLIVGCGASLIAWGNILIYADLARREVQQRFHRHEAGNLGADNQSAPANLKCHRALCVDWPVADRWKRPLIKRWDYVLDTNNPGEPKLADAEDVRHGLHTAARQPFRLVPFLDPAPLHEQVREAMSPDRHPDSTLEGNSLLLGFGDLRFEVSAIDLLFNQSRALLGEAVYARFRHEFPVRLDFQKTMNPFESLGTGDGWREERANLQERAPIEIRRHRFSKTVVHDTNGSVNVLNLVEGDEAVVESPDSAFEPFVVHHAETFIVPAAVGHYNIHPHGPSTGKEIVTIKAFVRSESMK